MTEMASEQLKLMHDELNRQLEELSTRQSGMNTRSTTLITAASVVAFGQAAGHGAMWASVGAIIVAGIAVLCAVLALLLHTSPAANLSDVSDAELNEQLVAEPYTVRYAIWEAGLITLRHGQEDLRAKAKWVNGSFGALGLSLLFAILAIAL